MSEYHKINSVFLRDPANNHKTFLLGQYADPAFGYLAGCEWIWTEKIDGTNIRVMWDGERVRFGGKTDNASIPAFLLDVLSVRFPAELMHATFAETPVVLYGEGFGARIQKGGGNYITNGVDFILFDVFCTNWLERANVEDIAAKLSLRIVPIVGRGTLAAAVNSLPLASSRKKRR